MASCSIVMDDGNLCGEAPMWDAAQQKLYWTDCVGRKFYAYDWNSARKEVMLDNFEVNGCALDQSGGFTFTNNSGVWFWNRKDKPISVVNSVGNVKLQLNDCIADPEGRLLAGSCFYDPTAEYPLGKLFCIQPECGGSDIGRGLPSREWTRLLLRREHSVFYRLGRPLDICLRLRPDERPRTRSKSICES
jgi:sugar lactone lactonase YvrE